MSSIIPNPPFACWCGNERFQVPDVEMVNNGIEQTVVQVWTCIDGHETRRSQHFDGRRLSERA